MVLKWTTQHAVVFPEEDIERICELTRERCYEGSQIREAVIDTAMGFDDCDYYGWGEDQTQEVIREIKRRLGGIQLSMFNDPFGVPDDYNEGWQ